MSKEHSFLINYHERAFAQLWDGLDETLSKLDAKYSIPAANVDKQEENFYMGVFTEAAGSHIQVVSACTLLESLVTKEFVQFGTHFKDGGNASHFRWKSDSEYDLNPRFFFAKNGKVKDRNNFINGHIQLCQACDMPSYRDSELVDFLKCMLHFRNYVVHNGLEWGIANVKEFKSKVGKKTIERYFSKATVGTEDWIYIVRPNAIEKLRTHVSSLIRELDEKFDEVISKAMTEADKNTEEFAEYIRNRGAGEYKKKNAFEVLGSKVSDIYLSLSRSQRFYSSSLALGMLWLFSLALPFSDMTRALLTGATMIGGLGVINDSLAIYKKIWSTLIGKTSILLVYGFLLNLSLASSAQVINSIVGVEPSNLIYSISFVSMLTIPVFVLGVSTILYVVVAAFGPLYFIISVGASSIKDDPFFSSFGVVKGENYRLVTALVRTFFIITFFGIVVGFGKNVMPKYEEFIENQATAFIYNFEAYSKSRCELKSEERAITINDNELVIVRKNEAGSYSFEKSACSPILINE